MMYSAITVSLVNEAKGGPFVFWDSLESAAQKASSLGFDAIEIFPPHASFIEPSALKSILDTHSLKLAAMGTGAGWVRERLQLADGDA